ncbi:DUF4411 family protein [Methanobacterium spitsbergense]|uniref:DUF4411 family protein n=1 Tax=Methanobacterium spitsbergense TaxID=2874285 RepID=A0A8T5UYG8_9EURY|nr:DUF4411 family protein [Methanobacterium spitsbergense]MBZ2164465.1 DUF4411 family protein [Methanobacterium spitsbergense]
MTDFEYIIDSSVILRRAVGQTFELDLFPFHWKNFDEKIQDGIFVSVPSVKTEINVRNKAALKWSNNNNIMFDVDMADPKVVSKLNFLSSTFPIWYEKGIEKPVWADPELIAFAMAHNKVLVTCEKCNINGREHNFRIPTICSKLGAYCHIRGKYTKNIPFTNSFQCIDFQELIEREKLYES